MEERLDIREVARRNELFRHELITGAHGTRHNFVNTGDGPLRLVTIYAPPEHPPGTVHTTK